MNKTQMRTLLEKYQKDITPVEVSLRVIAEALVYIAECQGV